MSIFEKLDAIEMADIKVEKKVKKNTFFSHLAFGWILNVIAR